METMALWGDEVLGHETLVTPDVLAAVFWLAGGVFLYLTVVRLVSLSGAFVATVFYLFTPYGVIASRVFMPDPLMVGLALLAVYLAVRYHSSPSRASLLWASLAAAIAIWVKPMSAFMVLPAFAALQLASRGLRSKSERKSVALYGAIAVIPAGAFYLIDKFTGTFPANAGTSFHLHTFLQPSFWHG